ncbi:hypothetical protein A3J17_04525 [Candidatus Curtissbacteria bacterium RIFCSPLOWO2_02_FULL_40_11]|uniref:Adenylate kinase n=1 Tax=Candidatus Curtissbacteria bacterium RIFCSPLOWO2_12_FULL_38_9 TaxID=1797735 RepID=A0A1F5I8N6_9BACT|nr:MAG: hypothetical protein A3J17_04525 [Candidatus Curtissbacteria bacterium RIFCSPLOWO2_02_FULL_40_11]OGE12744.1 MAG: hypothetical protein A3G14_03110 [Candidatus Curtissbacteria bacterium RIFCSPLOWO2_12_FULL_38_9]
MKIVFLGGQGSGKSTQAKLLAQKLKYPYFEMGELLRGKAKENSEVGNNVKNALEKGNLVPNQITINILKENTKNAHKGYVLDGFPRNATQMAELDSDIAKVYYIKVSDEEAVRRLEKRKRSDDNEQALTKRLEIYHQQTEPLLKDFRQKGILDEVNGERPIEEIHQDILNRVQDSI